MGVQPPIRERTILRAKRGRHRTWTDMSDGRSIHQEAVPVWCRCRLGRTRSGAHWSNLANAIESSLYGGDAALCLITLTTCCYYCSQMGVDWYMELYKMQGVSKQTHQPVCTVQSISVRCNLLTGADADVSPADELIACSDCLLF